MQDPRSDCPPLLYLKQVIQHYPNAARTYLELWAQKDRNNKVIVYKNEIRESYLISPAKFRNDLYDLAREGLINVQETWDIDRTNWHKLEIEIVGYDETY